MSKNLSRRVFLVFFCIILQATVLYTVFAPSRPHPPQRIMPRALLIGYGSFVGSRVARHLGYAGFDVIGTASTSASADELTSPLHTVVKLALDSPTIASDVAALFSAYPDIVVVVNCAAVSDFGPAEADPSKAYRINAPTDLYRGIPSSVRLVVAFSTDVVYPGQHGPHTEGAVRLSAGMATAGIASDKSRSVYAASKLAGEAAAIYLTPSKVAVVVLRSALVFGAPPLSGSRKASFVQAVEISLLSHDPKKWFTDELRSPISNRQLGNIVGALASWANTPQVSRSAESLGVSPESDYTKEAGSSRVRLVFNAGGTEHLSRYEAALQAAVKLQQVMPLYSMDVADRLDHAACKIIDPTAARGRRVIAQAKDDVLDRQKNSVPDYWSPQQAWLNRPRSAEQPEQDTGENLPVPPVEVEPVPVVPGELVTFEAPREAVPSTSVPQDPSAGERIEEGAGEAHEVPVRSEEEMNKERELRPAAAMNPSILPEVVLQSSISSVNFAYPRPADVRMDSSRIYTFLARVGQSVPRSSFAEELRWSVCGAEIAFVDTLAPLYDQGMSMTADPLSGIGAPQSR